jgi:DNA-binding MarR family transcriptional regulator
MNDADAPPPDLRTLMLERAPVRASWRLNYVANAFVAGLYTRMEAERGITRAEFVVLLCLSAHDGATAQEIADATRRPKNSLSRAVRALEKKGMIARAADPSDNRRQPIRLTAAGRAELRALIPMAEAREAQMLAPLGEQDRQRLVALLGMIAANFD